MNPLDIFIIIVFCFCLIRGIFRGLIKEVSSIIGVITGFYAAYTCYPYLAKILSKIISNSAWLNIISFMSIFCIIIIIFSMIGILIKRASKITFLKWTDKIMGGVFGAAKGILIIAIVLLILTSFLPKKVLIIKNSQISPFVTVISENMAIFIPKKMKKAYYDNIKPLKKIWKYGK